MITRRKTKKNRRQHEASAAAADGFHSRRWRLPRGSGTSPVYSIRALADETRRTGGRLRHPTGGPDSWNSF